MSMQGCRPDHARDLYGCPGCLAMARTGAEQMVSMIFRGIVLSEVFGLRIPMPPPGVVLFVVELDDDESC